MSKEKVHTYTFIYAKLLKWCKICLSSFGYNETNFVKKGGVLQQHICTCLEKFDFKCWMYRWSTAAAYLYPALKRQNLSTLTNVLVTKVIFEGKKAVGVELIEKGQTKVYKCRDSKKNYGTAVVFLCFKSAMKLRIF